MQAAETGIFAVLAASRLGQIAVTDKNTIA
jgi:hypothetical protein